MMPESRLTLELAIAATMQAHRYDIAWAFESRCSCGDSGMATYADWERHVVREIALVCGLAVPYSLEGS